MNNVEKIKMPRVFDDWVNLFVDSAQVEIDRLFLINRFYNSMEFLLIGFSEEHDLEDWVKEDYDTRYIKCIEAIIHGYEVEE